MLILKNGKTVRNEIIDLVINGDIIEDIIIKQSMSDQNYPKEVDAVQDSQEIDSCGGFNTPTLASGLLTWKAASLCRALSTCIPT